jgi:two-component system, OmpR family, response regulator MprA
MEVVVAEDDRAVREALVRALGLEGYTVRAVGNGAKALEALREQPADLVLLDVSMPVVDGLTVCRVLRSERNRVPILMLTARTETSDRVAGLDAGADDYVPKPFDLEELLARMRALARRSGFADDATAESTLGELSLGDLRIDTGRTACVAGRRRDRSQQDRVRVARTAGPQRGDRARPHHHLRPHLALRLRPRLEEPRGLHRLPPAQDRGRGRRG